VSRLRALLARAASVAAFAGSACGQPHTDGRVHIVYWEKWTGAEAAAMQATVDAFNASQDRIVVEFLSVSGIDRKTILATAGGDPPDVAGVWVQNLASWADMDALTPLDTLMAQDGITPSEFLARYEPAFADAMSYDGRVYGLIATPASMALHWNKAAFRDAGLDPERPPQTIEELFEFSRRLTRRDPNTGALTRVGFLPQDPGWWPWSFPRYFGGDLLSAQGQVVYDALPENVASMRWVRSYTELYGLEDLTRFASGFGAFGSPQFPFFAGKTTMVFQGVWLDNYLRQYAPNLEYGVAAWPAVTPGEPPFTIVEADMLVIPRGAKHPGEAWEFIEYVNSSNPDAQSKAELRGIELTCYLQQKLSPLKEWSPFFSQHHPHPFISVFRELAKSPRAYHVPAMGVWQEYQREINIAFDEVRLLRSTPEQAMAHTQRRIAASYAEHQRAVARQRGPNGVTRQGGASGAAEGAP
jgi:ABC-type glycerol-3-phosphate transport system substrate-binding protein